MSSYLRKVLPIDLRKIGPKAKINQAGTTPSRATNAPSSPRLSLSENLCLTSKHTERKLDLFWGNGESALRHDT